MKNLLPYFKVMLLPALNLFSFISGLYFSILFFIILMIEEAVTGKENELLKDDFFYLVQKISEFPASLFPSVENKKEVDLSGELS